MKTLRSFLCTRFFIITLIMASFFCVDTTQAQLQTKLKQTKEKLTQLKDTLGSLKKSLVKLKSNLNRSSFQMPQVDLWLSYAEKGDIDKINELLTATRDNQTDRWNLISLNGDDGWNALHWAAYMGNKQIVTILINMTSTQKMKDLLRAQTIKTPAGATALFLAARNGHKDIVQSLLNAAGENYAKELTKIPSEGKTAEQIANDRGYPEIVNLLKQSFKMPRVKTWLEYAETGNIQEIKKLIDATKDNPTDRWKLISLNNDGWNALHWAAGEGKEEVVTLLLKTVQELDPSEVYNLLSAQTKPDGYTALMIAAEEGHKNIVQKLLKAAGTKASELAKISSGGKTAELLARERNHTETASLLKSYADTTTPTPSSDEQKKWFTAIEKVDLDSVTKLIENAKKIGHDALWNLLSQEDRLGTPGLSLAVMYDSNESHKEIVATLLKAAGAKAWDLVALLSKSNASALGQAILNRNFAMTEMLVNVNRSKAKTLVNTEETFDKETLFKFAEESHDWYGKIPKLLNSL